MRKEDRKAAVAAYKERKVVGGIYIVRCAPTSQCWVGSAPNIETIGNRLWFSLGHGNMHCKSLQDAYSEYGRQAFSYEELERLPEEADSYIRAKKLRERLDHWCNNLDATAL